MGEEQTNTPTKVNGKKLGVIGYSTGEHQYWEYRSDSQKILLGNGWCVDCYYEGMITDGLTEGNTIAQIDLSNDAGAKFSITADFDGGIIREILIVNGYDNE